MHSGVLDYCLKNFILTYSLLTDVKPIGTVHVACFLSEIYYYSILPPPLQKKPQQQLMHVGHTYYY